MKKRLLSWAAALLTASLLALQLAGCGASSGGSAENATAATTSSYDQAAVEESGEMEIAAEAPTADSAAKVNYDTGGTLTDTLNQTTMPEDLDLKLIWRASVSMETLEFDQSVQQITDLVSEMGGFVESSSSSGGSDASGNYSSKYAYLTIRVPSDKLTGFMGSLNDCGTITSQNLSSENISLEYADTEARREALQTEYDRLLELMAQAEDVDAVIAIEARLSEVRLQLDSLSSQLRTYDNLVDYSTVNIDLYEVRNISGAAATTLTERIRNGFSNTLFNIQVFFEDLLVFVIVNIPVFVILAVVIVAVVLIVRKVRKRRQQRNQPNPPAAPSPDESNKE